MAEASDSISTRAEIATRLKKLRDQLQDCYVSQCTRSFGSCLLMGLDTAMPARPRVRHDPWPPFGFLIEDATWKLSLRTEASHLGIWEVATNEDRPNVIDNLMPKVFGKRVIGVRLSTSYFGLRFDDGSSVIVAALSSDQADNFTFFTRDKWVFSVDGKGISFRDASSV